MKKAVAALGILLLAQRFAPAADLDAAQKSLGIPSAIASVTDASLPESGPLEFILIEDIHRHPEAQANIAALLLHAYRHDGLRTVFMEGAYAGQTISPVKPGDVLRLRLEDGTLSGAEMAAAMVKAADLRLEGIEDPDVYRENVQAYEAAKTQTASVLQEIRTIRLLQQTWDVSRWRFSEEELDRLELLARLKLKPREYALSLENQEARRTSLALQRNLEAAERFYELADRRSSIFVAHALSDTDPGLKAILTGGFHAARMAQDLRTAGKSFVVLAPHVTRSGYEHLYAERMQETVSALKLR